MSSLTTTTSASALDPPPSASTMDQSPTAPTGDRDPGKPEIPWAFIDCSADTLVILISHMLNLLIEHNDQVILTPDALTRFHSRAAPGISVIDYLRRIVKYTNMEKIPLLSLLAYIDLTCAHLPTFTLSTLTVHRFLIAGVCAGSKAQCDVFCTNSHYAKVGGIKVHELNALEREFLRVTQWNLCCNADLLQRYYTSLIRSHGGFTQAASPDTSPFRAFPRSLSKPRMTGEDEEDTMVDRNAGEGNEGDIELASTGNDEDGADGDLTAIAQGGESSRDAEIRQRRKSVDEVLGVSAEGAGGKVRERGRRRRDSGQMDVEMSEAVSGDETQSRSEIPSTTTRTPIAGLSPVISTNSSRTDAPISPASSSIPSSSRSSLGSTSRRHRRPPSLTHLASSGSPADAVLDTRHADSRGLKTPDVLGGTVTGVPVAEEPQSLEEKMDLADGAGPSRYEIRQDPRTGSDVPVGQGSTDSTDTVIGEDHRSGSGSAGGSSNHGRILKNLVGVFRKRSSVPPPAHPPDGATGGHQPEQTTRSRPLTQYPSKSHEASNGTRQMTTPAAARHADGANGHQHTSDNAVAIPQSPGLAKNVTPRIRTRDERSVESLRDRGGLEVGVRME